MNATGKKTSVVICIPVLLLGGTEQQTLSLTRILCDLGYRVTVLCYYEYDERVVSLYMDSGAQVQLLNLRRDPSRSATALQMIALLNKLVGQYRSLDPDIVHVQYVAPGFIPIIAAKIAGVKIVFVSIHYPRFMATRVENLLVRLSARLCTLFLCNSRATEQSWFGTSMGFDPHTETESRKHFTIYNGIDIEFIDRQLENVNVAAMKSALQLGSEVVLGVVSRLHPRKGHRFLFDALRKVVVGDTNVVLLVVGSGPDREALMQYAETIGVARFIRWCGPVMFDDVLRYYAVFDLLIVPSEYEGFGLTAAEAMAAGLPVIASDVDGLREVIADGSSGLLVPYGDVEKLSSSVKELLSNPKKATEMGKEGKRRVEGLFSLARYREAIGNAYSHF